jgi:hypothetical protein
MFACLCVCCVCVCCVYFLLDGPHSSTPFSSPIPLPTLSPSAFRVLLRYLYTGDLSTLTFLNAMHVLAAARAYKLQGLEQACEQLLYRELGVQNCCEVWPLAVQLGDAGIVTRCIALIRANTRAVVESPSFLTLPPALLEQIVSWEEITIAEVELFTACVKWAQTQVAVQAVLAVQAAQAADAVPERVDSPTPSVMLPNDPFSLPVNSSVAALLAPLLPHLRFPTLSVDALLTTVSPTGVLPDGELLKLVTYAHKPTSTYTLRYIPYKRGRKPGLIVEPVKVELTYSSDFDENGLFFWLGLLAWLLSWGSE